MAGHTSFKDSRGQAPLNPCANEAVPRPIPPEEVRRNNGLEGRDFWAVIDGFVVDASEFVEDHPGGKKKLLGTDRPEIGATGEEFGFSFSRGKNGHYPQTAKCFRDGVERYLTGNNDGDFLLPVEVKFPPKETKIVILGKLSKTVNGLASEM